MSALDSTWGLGMRLKSPLFNMKSEKPVIPQKNLFGKKMYIFPIEYGTEIDPVTHKKSMCISINQDTTYIPVEEPVELSYDTWSLLKNIGRIGRMVGILFDEKA